MKKYLMLIIVLSVALVSQIPNTISWQGVLTDSEGNYIDGTYDITVKLYDTFSEGTELWSETHNDLTINNGLTNIVLGSITPFNLQFDQQYWLEIIIGEDDPLSRVALNSVPYSFYSERTNNVFVGDSLILKDSTGETKFILNPNSGTFKMMDNDTVWYELSVNSPVQTKTVNENGTYVVTDGETYKKLYDNNGDLMKETSYKDGSIATEKTYFDGVLYKSATIEKAEGDEEVVIEKADFYREGEIFKSQENKLKQDELIYSKQTVNGKILDVLEVSHEGANNEITVEKVTNYQDNAISNITTIKTKNNIDIEVSEFDANNIIKNKQEKYFEGDNNEIAVEKNTIFENGNLSSSSISKIKDNKQVEYIEYSSQGYIKKHEKTTFTEPNKEEIETNYYDEQGNFLRKETITTENGEITKHNTLSLTSSEDTEYSNGVLIKNNSTHSQSSNYGTNKTIQENISIDYFENDYTQRTETNEYSDENGDNYIKEEKIINGSSGYIANHVENQDGSSYTRIVQTPENVTVNADKNKTVGNTETTGTHEVGKDIYAKGTKCFRITHPEKSIKYLIHAAVESNEVLNKYSGNVTTGSDSLATVSLPSYFENVNTDYRYTLTVISTDFVQAVVYSEIDEENEFVIKTNAANIKVSWEVTARRNDDYMQDNPFEDEPYK